MKSGIIFIIALITLVLGVGMPVYFSATSQTFLQGFKNENHSLEAHAEEALMAGKEEIAAFLLNVNQRLAKGEEFEDRTLLESSPNLDAIGSSSQLLVKIQTELNYRYKEPNILPFLLQPEVRNQLKYHFKYSVNQNIQWILDTKNLMGWRFFKPVDSSSGAPLDAVINSFALMMEENSILDELLIDFKFHRSQSLQSVDTSFNQVENTYKSILSLLNRYNWGICKAIISNCESLQEIQDLVRMALDSPKDSNTILAASLLSDSVQKLNFYYQLHPKTGMADIEFALSLGTASLNELINTEKPIYRENKAMRSIQFLIPDLILEGMRKATFDSKTLGILLKLFLLLISGLAVSHFLLLQFRERRISAHSFSLAISADLAFATFFASLVVLTLEPSILQGESKRPPDIATLDLINLSANSENTMLKSAADPLDKVSIIILILFFLAQIAIYYYGLLRIADIKKQTKDPILKLKLLDNEDNLFDAGLYVGLGGTVCSLILLAFGVLNASLITAYASTLFGIIFVAILKIFNVRPLRNSLIMEQHNK